MNAIILAAGLGSRFKEMTKHTHKALLPIEGKPNLERTLDFLVQAGIGDIYIVVGYLKEQFFYLKDKYPVTLLENDHYADYNNIYSFALAKEVFGDSYLIESDVILTTNVFEPLERSTYLTTVRSLDGVEWCPVTEADKVVAMKVTDEKLPSLSGISYWSKRDAAVIRSYLDAYLTEEMLCNAKGYWDDIVVDLLDRLDVTTKELSKDSMYEMDTKEQYELIQEKLKG